MEFTLIYEGPLRSNGDRNHKHAIREYLRPQLEHLWTLQPLAGMRDGAMGVPRPHSVVDDREWADVVDGFRTPDNRVELDGVHFLPLVSQTLNLRAAIDITWFRPEPPGGVLQSGDIDNRLKTLFDGLQIPPHENQFPDTPIPGTASAPFHCLLQDDALISSLNVDTRRLLRAPAGNDVLLLIHVTTKVTEIEFGNIQLL